MPAAVCYNSCSAADVADDAADFCSLLLQLLDPHRLGNPLRLLRPVVHRRREPRADLHTKNPELKVRSHRLIQNTQASYVGVCGCVGVCRWGACGCVGVRVCVFAWAAGGGHTVAQYDVDCAAFGGRGHQALEAITPATVSASSSPNKRPQSATCEHSGTHTHAEHTAHIRAAHRHAHRHEGTRGNAAETADKVQRGLEPFVFVAEQKARSR